MVAGAIDPKKIGEIDRMHPIPSTCKNQDNY